VAARLPGLFAAANPPGLGFTIIGGPALKLENKVKILTLDINDSLSTVEAKVYLQICVSRMKL